MLTILIKFTYHISCLNDARKVEIKEILLSANYGNDGNLYLLNAVMKSQILFTTRCILLLVVNAVHENRNELETYLKEQDHSNDTIRIVEKCRLLKEDHDFHGSKLFNMCPTFLHWMAILNDSKAIEAYLEVSNL